MTAKEHIVGVSPHGLGGLSFKTQQRLYHAFVIAEGSAYSCNIFKEYFDTLPCDYSRKRATSGPPDALFSTTHEVAFFCFVLFLIFKTNGAMLSWYLCGTGKEALRIKRKG